MTGRGALHVVVAVAAAAALVGCTEVKAASTAAHKPASVTTVTGRPDTHTVTLTAPAAARIGLRTAPVSDDGTSRTVPSEALLFIADGRSYVYTVLTPLTFQREQIKVLADDGQTTRFTEGPAAGTLVVTTGATEVYGAEFEVSK